MSSLRKPRRRWLLLFNCQAEGLATCLELLDPELVVDRFDSLLGQGDRKEGWLPLQAYERIVAAPRIKHLLNEAILACDRLTWLPHVWFQGYHPDLCYLADSGPLARGPLGAYHSAIAYSAFRAGLDIDAAVQCYDTETFRALGYFDAWSPAKQQMLASFAGHGFDIHSAFVRWSRSGPFMHSVNHPKMTVLLDVARMLLARFGVEARESGILPHDNLANGPVFPVYPEIGARLGVAGSFYFKGGGRYRVKTLREFVSESFDVYRSAAGEQPRNEAFLPAIEEAMKLMEAIR